MECLLACGSKGYLVPFGKPFSILCTPLQLADAVMHVQSQKSLP